MAPSETEVATDPVADGLPADDPVNEDSPTSVPDEPAEATAPADTSSAEADVPAVDPAPVVTETATELPVETPDSDAALSFALAAQPRCERAPEQPEAIASGGSLDYQCSDQVVITGSGVDPSQLALSWRIEMTNDASWGMQMQPPTNDNEPAEWSDLNGDVSGFTFDQETPLAGLTSADGIDTTVEVQFQVRLNRPTCSADAATLVITHAVDVHVPETVETSDASETAEPLRITPLMEPIPEPSVAFAGDLSFGAISVTAAGTGGSTRTGTLILEMTGLNRSCGSWMLRLESAELTDETELPLDGSRLVVVAIDGEPLAGGGCDLAGGCDLIALAGGADAPEQTSLTLGIELRMPDQPQTGAFQTALTAALHPIARD